jgi:type II secretory pathway pseudopilin PulG
MKKINCFSLVELLLVMVITMILLGIVIPTFHKITKGVSVEMGVRQLGAQLKAVREYAITNREYVALIMEPADVSAVLPGGYANVAYRPCIVDSNYNFKEWVYGERWEFLPDTTQIKSMSGFTVDVVGVDCSDIEGGTVQMDNVPVFSSTGKCEGVSASSATLTVGETVGTSDTVNTLNITVAAFTGRVSYDN